jgi:TonB family protein
MRPNVTWRVCAVLIAGAVVLAPSLLLPAARAKNSASFVAPRAQSVTDIPYPMQVVASGLVSLEVQLDASGNITNIVVLRDFPGLTASAQGAVQNWTFAPATSNGQAVAAPLTVEVVFNTGVTRANDLGVPAPAPFAAFGSLPYTPPVVQSANFAAYPFNSVGVGAVILGAHVNASGQVEKVRVVRDVPSLTQGSVSEAQNWSFSAATFKNKSIASDVVIAFVFRANISSP